MRLPTPYSRSSVVLALLLALVGTTAACAGSALALGGIAVEAGRRLLLNTAEKNFDGEYNEQFEKLYEVLLEQRSATALASQNTGQNDGTSARPGVASFTATPAGVPDEPIRLDVTVVREVVIDGRPVPVPVEDGDVLVDGIGRDHDGDNLKIRFQVNTECYVYAVWIDATAWATPVFPLQSTDNPVEPDKRYSVPEGDDWLYLDDYRGVENLYFVASHVPIPELERSLESFAGRTREFREEGIEVALVDEPAEITRGLAGVRPGKSAPVTATDGTSHDVASQSFVSELASSDLVVTRWFRHE